MKIVKVCLISYINLVISLRRFDRYLPVKNGFYLANRLGIIFGKRI